ncbi:unnamed protein product (mitochondrion) [Plasmodiophora brassicae]|uniref:RecA family profile 1 domain-containing protein n=1 Tax=Plasmodiophora brassicae TaxID=37360 RepID=A0A3P3Y466_PLABS|nr:unnamed protein product [Plasmodiophora brassicae]
MRGDYASALTLYHAARKEAFLMGFGCNPVDDLLPHGGLLAGTVVMVSGETASGKTRLLLASALHTVRSTPCTVAYLHTQPRNAVAAMLASIDAPASQMARIRCYQCQSVLNLIDMLTTINSAVRDRASTYASGLRLVLIDDPGFLLSSLDGDTSANIKAVVIQLIRELAREHRICVVLTNRLVKGRITSAGLQPALGKIWTHVADAELRLRRDSTVPDVFSASIPAPRNIAPAEKVASFVIGRNGAIVEASPDGQSIEDNRRI